MAEKEHQVVAIPTSAGTVTDSDTLGSSPVMNEADEKGANRGPPPGMDFPEGGLKAWLAVSGASLVLFCTFGYANAFGVYQSYYSFTKYPQETASNISWIGSVQLFLMFVLGAFTGPMMDKGYFRPLFVTGSVFIIVSIFMISLCKQFWQTILAQAILQGLGNGLVFLPTITVISHYFRARRALATGVVVAGSSIGGVVFPIMLNELFEKQGFAKGVQASGYLILGCMLYANVAIHPRLKGTKHDPNAIKPNPKQMFSEPVYALAVASAFCLGLALFFAFFYLQIYCELNGLSRTISFYSLAILNAASFFGRTIPGFMADKLGVFNMLCVACAGSSVLIWSMFGATNAAGAVIFAILYGFFSGAYVSLMSPAFMSLAKSPAEFGIRTGLGMIFMALAALAGTPITGALLSHFNNEFWRPIVFCGVLAATGTTGLVVARTILSKQKGTWKV